MKNSRFFRHLPAVLAFAFLVAAFLEQPAFSQQVYVVDTLDDVFLWDPMRPGPIPPQRDGKISLREALEAANRNTNWGDAPGGDVGLDIIMFDPGLFENGPATIYIDPALYGNYFTTRLQIDEDVIIQGPGAEKLFLDGQRLTTVIGGHGNFVSIEGLTIQNGTRGAGFNVANLYLRNVAFRNNWSIGHGGALRIGYSLNFWRRVYIDQCSFFKNHSDGNGGAISFDKETTVRISNTTFVHNTADMLGGAIAVAQNNWVNPGAAQTGSLYVNNSTIMHNWVGNYFTPGFGGGIAIRDGAKAYVHNTIVANNTRKLPGSSEPDDYSGELQAGRNNLFGTSSGITFLPPGGLAAAGNLFGSSVNPLDPDMTQVINDPFVWIYYIPRPTSPVVNAGNNARCRNADNTYARFDQNNDDRIRGGIVDIGAIEF